MTPPRLHLTTRHSSVGFTRYGAQVLSFVPHNGPDVLWQTAPEYLTAACNHGKALRGGIPLCWPWFLAHPSQPGQPSHGLARLSTWELLSHTPGDITAATASAHLQLTVNNHPALTQPLRAELTIILTDRLQLSLTTTNLGTEAATLTQAIHTYLRVADVTQTSIQGLENALRRLVANPAPLDPLSGPLHIPADIEELYTGIQQLQVHDPMLERTLHVELTGTDEAVVWNPGPIKAAALDMSADAWRQLLCTEAAHVAQPVQLAPGASHTLGTTLYVHKPS